MLILYLIMLFKEQCLSCNDPGVKPHMYLELSKAFILMIKPYCLIDSMCSWVLASSFLMQELNNSTNKKTNKNQIT